LNPNVEMEDEEDIKPVKAVSSKSSKSENEISKSKTADIDPELAGMVDEDFLKSFEKLS